MSNHPTPAVIVDVDGTLADVSAFRHFVTLGPERKRKDFHAFHDAASGAPVIESTLDLVRDFQATGHAIIVVTARDAVWEGPTRWWLNLNDVPWDRIFHRPAGDRRKDFVVKSEILARIRAEGFVPVHAIDDNPNVIALWHAEGIPTTIVPGWED
jgi:hypothetical protein